MAELNTPSTEPQTKSLSVSSKSLAVQEALRLMPDPAATEEPAAGVLVTWREPLWAPPRKPVQSTMLALAGPADRPIPSVVSPPIRVTAASRWRMLRISYAPRCWGEVRLKADCDRGFRGAGR